MHGLHGSVLNLAVKILLEEKMVGYTLSIAVTLAAILAVPPAFGRTENFDTAKAGTLPADWTAGVTGKGAAVWKIETDESAPSRPNVLKASRRSN